VKFTQAATIWLKLAVKLASASGDPAAESWSYMPYFFSVG